jgi:hypothetical protein
LSEKKGSPFTPGVFSLRLRICQFVRILIFFPRNPRKVNSGGKITHDTPGNPLEAY